MKFLTILIAAGIFCSLAGTTPNPVPVPRHKFTVICHRGDHVKYPENTLEADAEAIRNDADYIEIDLRTTRDSQLVSMHDGTVNRMTDGTGQVKDFTLEQLEKLQVNVKSKLVAGTYRIQHLNRYLNYAVIRYTSTLILRMRMLPKHTKC